MKVRCPESGKEIEFPKDCTHIAKDGRTLVYCKYLRSVGAYVTRDLKIIPLHGRCIHPKLPKPMEYFGE